MSLGKNRGRTISFNEPSSYSTTHDPRLMILARGLGLSSWYFASPSVLITVVRYLPYIYCFCWLAFQLLPVSLS